MPPPTRADLPHLAALFGDLVLALEDPGVADPAARPGLMRLMDAARDRLWTPGTFRGEEVVASALDPRDASDLLDVLDVLAEPFAVVQLSRYPDLNVAFRGQLAALIARFAAGG